ncbi:putative hydroxymethylglutaryl-CoA lyase [Vibrio orientalis CIP 102891 = ATCC 33934]|uniref:hydroxymethylglutaryl-CoA lyase n=1 Tax=Vibrio orientalis CIP 102891 = ATCC 33934 TaxID=675816 RepID=C9QFR8_VIBOR|nr:hydroxymethylglutaryl-CoA lyase [Vibrio orientalis]EEX94211.1 hydroxymethylglutaryl-CoA lyase [Vibrio orientalis CIP 102891 = ATCC 33934]EGU44475.1 putative hydroxymethylglutaryl-CoA lyase [Vibrio orientalis CIP 102891 = ATCC 33934]
MDSSHTQSIVSALPKSVKIVEVGPRDGLQNEKTVPLDVKVELINRLSQTGLRHIESGAFVSANKIPQMADSEQVFQYIQRAANVSYSALTPNIKGLEQAIQSQVDEVAVFSSVSESFCQRNINCSITESLNRFKPVIALAREHNIRVRGYLSCVIDCPYDGATNPKHVASLAKQMLDIGCYEISLGDTIGTGTPLRVATMLEAVLAQCPKESIAVHFHDTYGQAIANIYQALLMGISTIDSSVAGLGGCPYAKGASGNVATEEVVYLCHGLGIETGVNLEKIVEVGRALRKNLN